MKKIIIALTLIAALLLAFGCSKGGQSEMRQYSANQYERDRGFAYDDSALATTRWGWEGTGYNGEGQAAPAFRDMSNLYGRMAQQDPFSPPLYADPAGTNQTERKLVKKAEVSIRVDNLEEADASVAALIEKYDAYAVSTEIRTESKNLRYSLRVPVHFYEVFLTDMNGLGRLISSKESTEDVTLRYYDLEGRLATQRELLKTFQSYLGKAKTIEEILSVEERLAELQNEIDSTGRQFRTLANQVEYATIELNIFTPVTKKERSETSGDRIKQLFGNFGGFLSSLVVILIGFVIYGIPILVILGALFWVLFGRIGLLKKLWRVIAKKQG
jgi:hypothetical protein